MRRNLDPARINSYNKFLATLDKTDDLKFKEQIQNTPSNLSSTSSVKSQIDKIIELINYNFNLNNIDSSNFTGQTQNDVIMSYITPNDPDKYVDFFDKKFNVKSYTKVQPSLQKENIDLFCPIKETININVEIKNVSDLLKLINTYSNDPSIKYNIDMKALHNIKEPLEELESMVGMTNLKNNVVDQILYFVQQLHKGKNGSGDFLHTVIYGPPGTGKTEVAKIMGKIYSKIGILSKGTFKKVTRSDLIAGYLGQTALKTSDVIKEAIGGVLFIDEAYSLGNPDKRDSFAKECIDTLCEALSDKKDNLMVIIAGYEKELKENFFSYNQGLDSRFTWRFETDKYSGKDLHDIFVKKVVEIGWTIEATEINEKWFENNKELFAFFGRDMETLLSKTKIAHSRRVFCMSNEEKKKIKLVDLDEGLKIYKRNNDSETKKREEEMKKYLFNTLYS